MTNYESMWKALKAQLEINVGSDSKMIHKGTLLQVIFLMNGLEKEKPPGNAPSAIELEIAHEIAEAYRRRGIPLSEDR